MRELMSRNRRNYNQIEEVAGDEKWLWLRGGSIKRETESLWQHKNTPLGQTQ